MSLLGGGRECGFAGDVTQNLGGNDDNILEGKMDTLSVITLVLYAFPLVAIGAFVALKKKWLGFTLVEVGNVWMAMVLLLYFSRLELVLDGAMGLVVYSAPVLFLLTVTAVTLLYCRAFSFQGK